MVKFVHDKQTKLRQQLVLERREQQSLRSLKRQDDHIRRASALRESLQYAIYAVVECVRRRNGSAPEVHAAKYLVKARADFLDHCTVGYAINHLGVLD
jgi:hypothetical protein